jgi:hypothetical protein
VSELDRRGRRVQLKTLELLSPRLPLSASELAVALGDSPDTVARRLRRYRRRGWVGRVPTGSPVGYVLRPPGQARVDWIRGHCLDAHGWADT